MKVVIYGSRDYTPSMLVASQLTFAEGYELVVKTLPLAWGVLWMASEVNKLAPRPLPRAVARRKR